MQSALPINSFLSFSFSSPSPAEECISFLTGHGSPDAMRNIVMKALLNRPKSSGLESLKSEKPRIESAAETISIH
jgi:hypothetical protein